MDFLEYAAFKPVCSTYAAACCCNSIVSWRTLSTCDFNLKYPPIAKFHAFLPKKKHKICNVLQITNYAAIVQQYAATWQFFYLEPFLTFQGTHLLSTIQNPKRLGLKYGFYRICCILSGIQHICCRSCCSSIIAWRTISKCTSHLK